MNKFQFRQLSAGAFMLYRRKKEGTLTAFFTWHMGLKMNSCDFILVNEAYFMTVVSDNPRGNIWLEIRKLQLIK